MVEANAKTLRPLVKPALRAAAAEHAWRPAKGGAFTADPSVVSPPLVTLLDPLLEGDAYGGLRFGLSVWVTAPEAEAEASAFGHDALPDDPFLDQGGWAVFSTSAGSLTDAPANERHWLVTDTDDVEPVVEDWAAVLGGPAAEWVAARSSVDRVVAAAAADPQASARHPFAVRLIPLMALRLGRADAARLVIGASERGMDDSPERIAEFERRLAAAHPEYGPLQRS